MIAERIIPPPYLRHLVREFVLFHAVFEPGVNVLPKSYPVIPEEGLIFILRGTLLAETPATGGCHLRSKTFIFGPPASRQNLHISHEYLMLCVRFQPGALFRLLRIPMPELVHNYVDAELAFGSGIKVVHEQMANAGSYEEIMRICNRYMHNESRKLKADVHPMQTIGEKILDDPQRFTLDAIAREACLSQRQFQKRFLEQIGISPKLFSRICRFHGAWQLKESGPSLDWLSVAVRSGYSDYQHLVKDFKQFSGTTPNIFLTECEYDPERVLNISASFKGA